MANIINRASVAFIKEETTEGTPVAPAGATEAIALQDDFDITPAFNLLENAEMKNSLGKGKSIVGAENPTASGSHYLRHSGTEGTAPSYGPMLEGAFGAVNTEGSEYSTTSGSAVSSIAITSAGANLIRGAAMLLKDGVNGYSIRPIHSLSTNAAVPGFNVGTAPASGVAIGKSVTYYPANSGHKSYSIWHYLGNGGATQMMTGAKFTELSMSFSAGDLINLGFSAEGLGYYFNPIEITASTRYIDWEDDDGTFAAAVPVRWYKDPHDLASALQTAMNATATTEVYTVTYSNTTGKFSIVGTGTLLTLEWNTGANTANTIGTKIGFTVSADDSGTAATTGYTSDNALSFAAPYTPTYDSADPIAAKNHELFLGDATDTTPVAASSVSFTLTNTRAPIGSVSAESGQSGSIFSARMATVSVTALLDKFEANRFRKFRENEETRFAYNFGTKVGGNWVAGKCGCLYLPTMTITSFDLQDQDGLVAMNLEGQAFVNAAGDGEVYLSFV